MNSNVPYDPLREKIEILEKIATLWNRDNIMYAVANGLEGYPKRIGRDLDLVMLKKKQIEKALRIAEGIFAEEGFQVLIPPKIWGKRLLALKRSNNHELWIEIHTIKKLSWGVVDFSSRNVDVFFKGPFKVNRWDHFVKRVLIPFLSGVPIKMDTDISSILEENPSVNSKLIENNLKKFLGSNLGIKFYRKLRRTDEKELVSLRKRISVSVVTRFFFRKPFSSVANLLRKFQKTILQYFSPCGPVVALVGQNHEKKTSVINNICQYPQVVFSHAEVIVKHIRPYQKPFQKLYVLNKQNRIKKNDGSINASRKFDWFRLIYYYCQFIIGYYLKDMPISSRQQLILYTEHAVDMMASPFQYELSSQKGIELLYGCIKKPDLVILLYDEPEQKFLRTPEISIDEIQHKTKEYLELYQQGYIDAIIESNSSPLELTQQVKFLISQAFIKKNNQIGKH